MTEEDFKKNLANNLIHYRRLANLTQSQLAEAINYSDKSVSKWERGEGLPDVYVLTLIAAFYNISLNDLIAETPKKKLVNQKKKKVLVTLLAVGVVWLVAVTVFVLLNIFAPSVEDSWLAFIYAIPVTAIVVLIFSSVWGNKIVWCISTSVLVWGVLTTIYLSFLSRNIWMIYLIGVPLQALTVMWFFFRSVITRVIDRIENKNKD